MAGMDDDIDAFYRMAEAAIAEFPQPFRKAAGSVLLRVVDWPPEEYLEPGEDPLMLTGIYDGVPMTEKSFDEPAAYPDMVWLFREPILAEWRERGNEALSDLVAHVTVHEFAHHFGWSDDDIAVIDKWWT